MNVLSLDLSTTETGYSVCKDGTIACFDIIKPHNKLDAISRSFIIAQEIEKLLLKYSVEEIIIEDSYIAFASSAMLLGKLHGMVAYLSFLYLKKQPIWITATHVRKVMGIRGIKRGKEGKKDIIYLVNQLGFPLVTNDNVADAILLALCYLKESTHG